MPRVTRPSTVPSEKHPRPDPALAEAEALLGGLTGQFPVGFALFSVEA